MTEHMHILYGFNEKAVIDAIEKYITLAGYTITSANRTNKMAVQSYLEEHPECDVVVLKEAISDKSKYEADEIAELMDISDVNIIYVLSDIHRGQPYMQTLYVAGVTSAIFVGAAHKKGASANEIAALCMHKRGRKEAREYYGINEKKVSVSLGMTAAEISNLVERLGRDEYGPFVIDRFLHVVSKLNAKQANEFIKHIPEPYISELKQYIEFYEVCEGLRGSGITPPYTMPGKKVKAGLISSKDNAKAIEGLQAEQTPYEEDPDIIDLDKVSDTVTLDKGASESEIKDNGAQTIVEDVEPVILTAENIEDSDDVNLDKDAVDTLEKEDVSAAEDTSISEQEDRGESEQKDTSNNAQNEPNKGGNNNSAIIDEQEVERALNQSSNSKKKGSSFETKISSFVFICLGTIVGFVLAYLGCVLAGKVIHGVYLDKVKNGELISASANWLNEDDVDDNSNSLLEEALDIYEGITDSPTAEPTVEPTAAANTEQEASDGETASESNNDAGSVDSTNNGTDGGSSESGTDETEGSQSTEGGANTSVESDAEVADHNPNNVVIDPEAVDNFFGQ